MENGHTLSPVRPNDATIFRVGASDSPCLAEMLTQQLREMERDGIVKRNVYAEVPPKVEYSLTNLGQELRPALHELVIWAASRRKTLDSKKNTHNVVAKLF